VSPAPGPAGCAMARLTATMPVAQAVGAYAALRRLAESRRAQGDARAMGQLMSDELFARMTGASGTPGAVNVEVGLVMTERNLLRGGADPALLTDDEGRTFTHVPAVLARALVRQADRAWLSRLYAAPDSGELVAMDSRRRTFTGRLRRLLLLRDQTCRMPWCEAPIRHADHVREHASGGPTALANGAGLCESCNYLKQAPGWRADIIGTRGQVIEFTTPTGHRYRSQPPPAPGHQQRSLEDHVERVLHDHDDGFDPNPLDGAA
ncbi:MAG: HNH endonuclease signature motif containing protein, partial [Candidatus Nanopelagicales bacterium]